jgi:2,3-dihydroxybenzoate decarboxylase
VTDATIPPLPLPPPLELDPSAPCAGPLVDADGLALESPEAWTELPDQHCPRLHRDDVGREYVVVGDTIILTMSLGALTRPGSPVDDPIRRLRAMDAESIDQAVLYPTVGRRLGVVADPAAAVAIARADNEWLAGYCRMAPHRLFAAAVLPLQDPAAATVELRRAVTDFGCRVAFIDPQPSGRSLSDQAYGPVWEAAEELGVVLTIGQGSSASMPGPGSIPLPAGAQLIALGILERHPGLRCCFLASSGGWDPSWLVQLDEQVEALVGRSPDLQLAPSEYFVRQCAIRVGVDETTLPALVSSTGAGRILWGSDDRQHDATFTGAARAIRRTVAPCNPTTQIKVLGLNARHLYGLPSHLSGPAAWMDDYFSAVTARDLEYLARLFAPDAVLESGGIRLVGRDAVLGYYRTNTFTFDDFRPAPGPLDIDPSGQRVTVDIDVRLGGQDRSVHDVFEFVDGRITSLRITGFEDALRAARR